jgi:hypothetical protein
VTNVTKWIVFTCLIFTVNILQAQITDSDSSALQTVSKGILEKEFDFFQKKGKLENVLYQLSLEQNVKFSYSPDRIQHIEVSEKFYKATNLTSLLSSLLLNTGYNYIVIGRIIVIVEDDKNVNIVEPISENLKSSTDSLVVHSTDSVILSSRNPVTSGSSSTIGSPSNVPKPFSDSIRSNTSVSKHLYSSDLNLSKLPEEERRKIKKIYEKELKWAYNYHKIKMLNLNPEKNDSLVKANKNLIPIHPVSNFNYFVSGNLGIIKYMPRIKGNSEFSWDEDLDYHKKIKAGIRPEISFGFITKHLMAGAGIGYQQFKMEENGVSIYKKSNGIGNGQGNKTDTFSYSFSDKYTVFSIPLEVLLFKQRKNFFAGIGSKLKADFIYSKIESDQFKTYYEQKVGDGTYYSKNYKIAMASSLKVMAGMIVQNNFAISAGMEYYYYLSPYQKNSIFSFYPNTFQIEVSLLYFLNKSDLKRIFGGS